jgi:CHAT domain-containing protein
MFVWRSLLVALALCAVVLQDTKKPTLWPRTIEPRLTVPTEWQPCRTTFAPDRAVVQARCGAAPPAEPAVCGELGTREQALLLLNRSQCLDKVTAALERLAPDDPSLWTDLAAAYYVHAQTDDRASSDLLRAREAAQRAVSLTPRSPAALFNRALIDEALGLPAEWDEFLAVDRSEWAAEARAHRDGLRRHGTLEGALLWAEARPALARALENGDRTRAQRLIAPFPGAAQSYLLDELLPAWAEAPTAANLDRASTLADAWSNVTGDRLLPDAIRSIRLASPAQLAALRVGHRQLHNARSLSNLSDAGNAYRSAVESLQKGGSPLAAVARLGLPVTAGFANPPEWLAPTTSVEQYGDQHHYKSIVASAIATEGYLLFRMGHSVESLTAYEKALALYQRLNDAENAAIVNARLSGILRQLQQNERSWHEALRTLQNASHIVELRHVHVLLGETADTAGALGFSRVALLYQNMTIDAIRRRLLATPPEDLERLTAVQQNLAIALRARAGMALVVGETERAQFDIAESARLRAKEAEAKADTVTLHALQAHDDDVLGQHLVASHSYDAAAAAFTSALDAAKGNQYQTFFAQLFLERSNAYRRGGRRAEAAADIESAIGIFRAEEIQTLGSRRPGERREDVIQSYLSRPDEVYALLVRELLDQERTAEAFAYTEEARGLEPLADALRSGAAPPLFQDALQSLHERDLGRIRASIPDNTLILEYGVFDDRTYVWILSRNGLDLVRCPVSRGKLEEWNAVLRKGVNANNEQWLGHVLDRAYNGLIAPVLNRTGSLQGKRLVFVPDRGMHGLPFAAMRDPAKHRYLIQDAPVSVAGSTMLYLLSVYRDSQLPRENPSSLLVGDPDFDRALEAARYLDRLGSARLEVDGISPSYGSACKKLIGSDATAANVFAEAPSRTVIHIAAHLIADEKEPLRSVLLLAKTPTNSGAIDAQELLAHLKPGHTRLVVLAACSSAGGLPIGSEGVAPLVEPFITNGVPAVVGSLWNIGDATVKDLLVSFHRQLRDGHDAAVALQLAQIELITGGHSALTWSAFEVVGYASSPFPPRH